MGTFGRTSIEGITSTSNVTNRLVGGKYNCPEETTALSISVYLSLWTQGNKMKCAIYAANKNFIASTEEQDDGAVNRWVTFNFASPPDLVNADYILIVWSEGATIHSESGFPANTSWWESSVYNNFPASVSDPTSSFENCIYCTYGVNYDRSSSVIIGTVATSSRILAFDRDALTIVGNVASASRIYGGVKSASLIIGTLITSGTDWAGTVTVYVGVKTTASRIFGKVISSLVIVGVVASASRVISVLRTSSTIIGIVASASRALALIRTASTQVGVVVSATRALTYIRASSVISGIVASVSKSKGIIRTASVAIGIVVRFSIWVKLLRRLGGFAGRTLSAITKRGLSAFAGRGLSDITNRDLSDEDETRNLK